MRFPVRFFPQKTSIDFMRGRYAAFMISGLVMVATIALLFTRGLSLGIDFAGGIVMEIHQEKPFDLGELREFLAEKGFKDASLQEIGAPSDIMIRLAPEKEAEEKIDKKAEKSAQSAESKTVANVKKILSERYGEGLEFRKVDYVGPKVGGELIRNGALAAIGAFLGIMVYLWFRFEWQYGVGALLALMHDAWVTVGFYSLTGLEFNLTSIAAILTIIGYSVNDSVVIYDRVREQLRKYKKLSITEILNISLNETLSRTILTVTTTLLALVALAVLGGETLKSFTLACLFGIVVGTYSSIYISVPVLIYMNLRTGSAEAKPSDSD